MFVKHAAMALVKRESIRPANCHEAILFESFAFDEDELVQRAVEIDAAVRTLSARQRSAIVAHYWWNDTHDEIASSWGTSRSSVNVAIRVGQSKLAARLPTRIG